jgi:hypothetical protein
VLSSRLPLKQFVRFHRAWSPQFMVAAMASNFPQRVIAKAQCKKAQYEKA